MTTRTTKYNASEKGELIRYRIEVKNNSGKWHPLRIRGSVKMFDNPYHANNYGKLINPFHRSLC